MAQIKINTSQK